MMSVNWCWRSRSTRNSMTGRLMIGIIGLGTVSVIGRTRVPFPAARIIAFTKRRPSGIALNGVLDRRVAREHAVQADDFEKGDHRLLHFGQPDVAVAPVGLQRLER